MDAGRYKQFRRGIDQLDGEGVVQVLRSDLRGQQSPVLAAVGPMQFEVAVARMESEFGAPIRLEMLGYTQARRTDAASAAELDAVRGVEVMARNDGTLLALAPDKWRHRRDRARPPGAHPRAAARRRPLTAYDEQGASRCRHGGAGSPFGVTTSHSPPFSVMLWHSTSNLFSCA